jgi:hypothetical protein
MDIEWVIYHLIHNDDDFESVSLDIDYYDGDVWDRLLTSLYRNTVLTKILLIRAEVPRSRTRTLGDLRDLFQAIREIPTVGEVELLGGFTGTDLDFSLPDFLQDHATMQKLQIIVSDGTLSTRVLESMASARQLREIVLEVQESSELGLLYASPTLERLRVDTYGEPLEDEHLFAMAEVLRTNTRLEVLDMDYTISTDGLGRLADMLRENVCLKELRLAVELEDDEGPFLDLMDAMGGNDTLSVFYNYRFRKCEDISRIAVQNQLELLEQNTTLHSFVFFLDKDERATKEKNVFLALNKGGRGRLFKDIDNTSKGDWIDVLANPLTVNNLDCLFYYLSANPSLCKCDGPYPEETDCVPSEERHVVGDKSSPAISNSCALPIVEATPEHVGKKMRVI